MEKLSCLKRILFTEDDLHTKVETQKKPSPPKLPEVPYGALCHTTLKITVTKCYFKIS